MRNKESVEIRTGELVWNITERGFNSKIYIQEYFHFLMFNKMLYSNISRFSHFKTSLKEIYLYYFFLKHAFSLSTNK